MNNPVILMLCLLNAALLAVGQMLFRLGAHGREISAFRDVLRLLFYPHILAAVTLYAGATLLWIYILTKAPLSYAYPIQALAFPLVVVLSAAVFHETVPIHRWVGIGVIMLGVFIASKQI